MYSVNCTMYPAQVVCCTLCLCMAVAVLSSVSLVYLTFIVYKPAIKVQYTAYSTLHTAHCSLSTAHCTLHTAHYKLHTTNNSLYTVYSMVYLSFIVNKSDMVLLWYNTLCTAHTLCLYCSVPGAPVRVAGPTCGLYHRGEEGGGWGGLQVNSVVQRTLYYRCTVV